ncbi:hypothetical protein CHLRE_03g181650v5 [Chlamydomonas reinhardtii]|uniref:Non-structural maintenance of chromosomes element 1 homolog n=1 Tax=Chlamydomonas reinhardtii TaxID=3055 RepID=A0A2K3DXU5_CHLRE|nr:uncharacterized protein CHLRE_03g181650v5 [Chlamydomonas reinhardtii]PNW85337.1 hypothetical protein CHLRE_03g181650v5 [Chlamydomonas reinhardtii]
MQVLSKIQNDIQWLEMNIERIKLPMNNEWYLCLVNKDADEAAKQMGSCFTIDQLAYFRAVVEKIGTHPPSGDALIADVNSMVLKNVVPMPASAAAAGSAGEPATQPAAAHAQKSKLSVVEREETLHKLASQGWLFMAREGYYTLGPRTLLEMKSLVLSTLSDEAARRLENDYM